MFGSVMKNKLENISSVWLCLENNLLMFYFFQVY